MANLPKFSRTKQTITVPKKATLPVMTETVDPVMATPVKRTAVIQSFFSGVRSALTGVKFSYTPFLVLLLWGASYLIGKYQSEITYLKMQAGVVGAASSQGASAKQVGSAFAEASANPTATPVPKIVPVTDTDHIRGNLKQAELVIVEYSDYECPFCKSFHPTMKQVMDSYGDQVAWVYRQFPLSIHANAAKESEASECVAELGGNEAFWQFSDALFDRTTSNGYGFSLDKLAPLAAEFGMPKDKVQSCIDSGKYTKKVEDDLAAGANAGVSGTPTAFVLTKDGKLSQTIPGALPFTQVKEIIDTALKK